MKTIAMVCFALLALGSSAFAADAKRPNIIVILVDDMGYSDVGCYGSEIPTPNLDALAADGIRFTQFYNTARCCPTRASLLTGLYPHQAGVGHMTEDKKLPGYQGHLNDKCVTIGEVLGPAGYFTAMTGKWHVGQNLGTVPWERGYQRSLNAPAGGYYYDHNVGGKSAIFLNGKSLDPKGPELPKNWYSTDLWTSYGLKFIDEAIAAKKPFYLHLCHNAPHFPLQAPPEDIAQFRGKYKTGWDALRESRNAKQVQLGLVEKSWGMAPRPEGVSAWKDLSPADQDRFDNIMAIYAAAVNHIDKSIGDLVAGLKKRGVYDNTLIMFMSDNGGNAESGPSGRANGPGVLGSADSTVFCGESWAFLENTPFRRYKHFNHEGGISTPLIAHWPAGISAKGELRKQPGHLIDIMATCVDVSHASYPKQFKGKAIQPMEGKSLIPAFADKPIERDAIYWEHEGNAAVRVGDSKLVRFGPKGAWELYDLKADRTELHDLAKDQPDKVKELAAKWETWAKRANVLPAPPIAKEGAGEGEGKPKAKKKKAGAAAAVAPAGSTATHFDLKPDANLLKDAAPEIANHGFSVNVKIDKPGTEGVLVAQGGARIGWALFMQEGKLHFMVNREGKRSQVVSDDPAIRSAKEITATIDHDANASLSADGREIAKKKLAGLVPTQPIDGLQVGRDIPMSVGEYPAPFEFNGTISGATLQIAE